MTGSRILAPIAAACAVVLTVILMFVAQSRALGVAVGILDLIAISVVYVGWLGSSAAGSSQSKAAVPGGLEDLIQRIARGGGEAVDLSSVPSELAGSLDEVSSRMRQMAEEIDELSPRDELTSLAKEGVFNNVLWREFNRAQRYSEPLSLALVRVGGLGDLRAGDGPQAADDVLKNIASLVLQMVRDTDLAARYGSDHLAIIMPGTDAKGAGEFCARFRRLLGESPIEPPGASQRVEVALGVASMPEEGIKMAPQIVERAAAALEPLEVRPASEG